MYKRVLGKLQKSYGHLFNFYDDLAKGRCCMLLSGISVSVIGLLTSGLFYTSFLIANGIDIVNIGIISFVPFIANCLSIFSPVILERFARRRMILSVSRITYYTLNILTITVMPLLVSDAKLKMVLFVVIVFAANIINALFSGGYQVWHVNFIPDNVRAEYFSVNTLVSALIQCGTALVSGIIADMLAGSAYEDTIIVIFRYAAYALAILDVAILAVPKEFPYEKSQELPRLRHIITKPLQHKKFALTMAMVFGWTFCMNVPQSSLNYYLLNNVGVSYSFIQIINMFWPFFLMAFLPFWNKILKKRGWFVTFALSVICHFPTTLMYSCVTAANYIWLLPTVRLTQHFIAIGRSISYSNMVYINLPKEDQTNYIAFNTLIVNIASFLGMMAGTGFVAAYPDIVVNIAGLSFTNVQMLMWVQAFGELGVPLLIFTFLKKLTPDTVG